MPVLILKYAHIKGKKAGGFFMLINTKNFGEVEINENDTSNIKTYMIHYKDLKN